MSPRRVAARGRFRTPSSMWQRLSPEAHAAGIRMVLGDGYGIIVLPRGRHAGRGWFCRRGR